MVSVSVYIMACFGGGRGEEVGAGAREGTELKISLAALALLCQASREPGRKRLLEIGHCGPGETASHPTVSSCFLLPGTHQCSATFQPSQVHLPAGVTCKQIPNPFLKTDFSTRRVFHDQGVAGKLFCLLAGLNPTA